MRKIQVDELNLNDENIITETIFSYIVKYGDNILKIHKPEYLELLQLNNIDIEKKILYTEKISDLNEMVLPISILYFRDEVVGYEMENVSGVSYDKVVCDSSYNLMDYAKLYYRFEQILEKATNNNIVITDFCSTSNILFLCGDKGRITDNDIKIIDYGDMQVADNGTIIISSGIHSSLTNMAKYKKENLYTTELNSLSLLYLYFSDVLHVDLKIAYRDHFKGNLLTLPDLLNMIGLNDNKIIELVNIIYDQNVRNPRFSDVFFKIAELYDLCENHSSFDNISDVKLVKKK